MQLKYLQTIVEAQDGPAKVMALAWAPNNIKLAVCGADRIIYLFDDKGERKDKFPTKPADSRNGRKSYVVKGLSFSPDSTKLAVAQSDSIIFIYKLGDDWGDKKVICNKFIQQCPVTSMVWLTDGPIIYGQSDGKVRAAHIKANKTQTLYASNSFVVALCLNVRGTGVLSGHADGSIVRYYVSEDQSNTDQQQGRVVQHPVPPYALSWPAGYILAAGSDRIVTLYESDGRVHRIFDYTASHYKEREFTVACSSPSGQAVTVGSYDNIKLFAWSPSKSMWEEKPNKVIPNLYTISALAWKRDGSRIACGGLCGSVELFESVLKRTIWKGKFEMIYVSPSQVLVKPLSGESRGRGVILKSQYGYEITDVAIMGNDRYLVARTPDTLLLGDLHRNLLSEVLWPDSGRNEKFYFDNITVCLVFNAGELSIIEYGNNEILTCVRTEFMNPHLISVRLNERKQVHSPQENKKLAYLLDLHTICVIDLITNLPTLHINHDSKIDWLELNETAHKLLYRDKKMRLTLLDIRTSEKHNILNYCTFVQWLPGSDVVVAQSRHNACVWYNIDTPDRITQFPVRGDIFDVIRENGQSEILTQDGNHQLGYELDESLIEFGTAVHDSDFGKAILYLESLGMNKKEAEGMWQNLAEVAIQLHNLHVAEICYAALGDIATTHFLQETIKIGDKWSKENNIGDPLQCPELWVRMSILNKQFKVAEGIYLENNEIDKAIDMYLKLYKWEDALYLAETNNYQYPELKKKYIKWLTDTKQEDKAGELYEKEGDHQTALNYYLKANFTSKACKLVQSEPYLLDNHDVVSQIVKGLIKNESYIQAGQIYEFTNDNEKALECYRKGKVYDRCIDLTRKINPKNVTALEEEWGDHLIENKQYNAAINHYIEAGKNNKALDTSIRAKQWKKAVQILQVITNKEEISEHVKTLAKHFKTLKDYKTAEKIFLHCDMYDQIVDMYNQTGQWEKAYAVAEQHLNISEMKTTFIQKCKQLEEEVKFKEAERLYLIINEPDLAISMFKNQKQYENMMRLVRNYHPDLVDTTLLHLAQECEEAKKYKQAEKYYIDCNEWKLAIKMYRNLNLWEDAYRIALNNGGQEAVEPVVFLWAKSLGGDSAVRLLNRLSLLESCISNACDTYQFEFAFELARIGMKSKLEEVHYKYALVLEDNGQFSEAETQFIKANKPKEAISMYVHNQDWENAERIANEHDPSSIGDILLNQSKFEFENENFSKFETLLLRAHKVDLIIEKYKMNRMWNDALRVCGEYVPSKLPLLQQEYEKEINTNISKDIHSLITQARQWEQNGEFYNAVECYLRIKNVDTNLMVKILNEVTQLTLKYLNHDQCYKIISNLIPKLMEYKLYDLAVRVYLNIDMVKEAVDIFIYTQNWNKARKLCAELQPEYLSYVENQYKEWLKKNGDADMLSEVDINTALDMLMKQGQWNQCLDRAKNINNNLLHKYMALYAMHLIKNKEYSQLTEMFHEYGTPNIPQFYNIYKQTAYCILNNPNENVNLIVSLRNMLYNVIQNQCNNEEIDKLMFIAHLMIMKCLLADIPSAIDLVTAISIALLRYTDVIVSDKAYYDAGYYCQQTKRDSEAFVFWNHYLDICDAIEDNNTDNLEHTDLIHTDFPQDITLPTRLTMSPDQHEHVKNWVLALSVDRNRNATQGLPTDNRKVYIGSLYSLNEQTTDTATPCVVTGWPIINPQSFSAKFSVIQFANKKYANKDNYKIFMDIAKFNSSHALENTVDFMNEWCVPVN
uniref:Intraflagellar transport protein 172 homolog n=2 Tax=Cacopsylla melanoneura TaxID=428564 RepID=A0A8D8QV38_9HEMI